MGDNFEDRLRRSLQAHAGDVTPDPAMYREVQTRIRRGRALRWSVAGAGAVATVAVVALAFPALNDRRVEFEPAPVATQPPSEEPTPAAASSGPVPVPNGMVFTDGLSSYVMALDGESAESLVEGDEWVHCPPPRGSCAERPAVTAVAVAPTTTFERIGVAAAGPGACDLPWAIVTFREEDGPFRDVSSVPAEGSCATAPVFSPDGGHLAWASEDADGVWSLRTVDWTADGAGINDTAFALDWGAGATDVALEDWVWTSVGPDGATGYLVLAVRIGDHLETYRREITRQADGAVSLFGDDSQPMGGEDGATPVAFADAKGSPDDPRVSYSLDVVRDEMDALQGSVVRRVDGREDGAFELPPELFNATNPPFDVSDLWLEAMGDTVLYGDGHGMAWSLRWTGAEFDRPRNLPTTIVHADLFGGERPERDEQVAVLTHVDVFFGLEGVGDCSHVEPVTREVEGPGVARAALNELLAGPNSAESNGGYRSPFSAATADALLDISISDGVARADFRDFRHEIAADSCTKVAVIAALEATLLQFPSVDSTRFSFDGDETEFGVWAYGDDSRAEIPLEVAATASKIREAVGAAQRNDNWDLLAELIDREKFSCSFSDHNEDCITLWRDQQAGGDDPLRVLAEILQGAPAKVDGAPIWAWPAEFAETDDYLGPRTGIQRNGTWRYYQQGGD